MTLGLWDAALGDFSFTPIGALPGYPRSTVEGVSADGSVLLVNLQQDSSSPLSTVATWTRSAGLREISLFPGRTVDGLGSAISPDGSTIAGRVRLSFSTHEYDGFLWNAASGTTLIGRSVAAGGPTTQIIGNAYPLLNVQALSENGQVATGYLYDGITLAMFRWTSATGALSLVQPVSSSMNAGFPIGISNDGSIIVGESRNSGFRWELGRGFIPLTAPLEAARRFDFEAITGDGIAMVGTVSPAAGMTFPFLWSSTDGYVILDSSPTGPVHAVDLSDDTGIVVGTRSESGTSRTVFWNQSRRMIFLDDYLVTRGVDLGGWQLESPRAISADGLTIVGNGINSMGETQGWVVTIPEISSMTLAIIGAATMAAFVHRRRSAAMRTEAR